MIGEQATVRLGENTSFRVVASTAPIRLASTPILPAIQPGDTGAWTKISTLPSALVWGPNSVAVTSDGTHSIFVGSMWATGLWRYVEP